MIKREELSNPSSCLSRARDDEEIFVILERDDTFSEVVRYWAAKRIEKGKNTPGDAQITEALTKADRVENSRKV